MNEKDVYTKLSSLLNDYLHPLGMLVPRGPLRAMAELVRGIVFTSSPQLSNAGRLLVDSPRPLRRVVDRLSGHLADPNWNHGEWAAAVLQHLAYPESTAPSNTHRTCEGRGRAFASPFHLPGG